MNKERLLLLALALDYVQDQENKAPEATHPPGVGFDIGTWKNPCGTVACAVGWAAELKLFPGFHISRDFRVPTYKGTSNWRAVSTVFDITGGEAEHLFMGRNYPGYFEHQRVTPAMVAARIREFVAD